VCGLRAEVARRWSVECMRADWCVAWRTRLTRLQQRPVHPKKDAEAEATLKKLHQPGARSAHRHTAGTPIEIWFSGRGKSGPTGDTRVYLGTDRHASVMVRDNRHDPPTFLAPSVRNVALGPR